MKYSSARLVVVIQLGLEPWIQPTHKDHFRWLGNQILIEIGSVQSLGLLVLGSLKDTHDKDTAESQGSSFTKVPEKA